MSTNYNPRIVTDSLTVALDAANSRSYSGTGTTWSDLSGNGNTGTLTNGPTYNSANGGSIVFDGLNDAVLLGSLGSFYSQGTISFWMNSTAAENYRNPFTTKYNGVNAGIRFEQYSNVSPYGGFTAVVGNDGGSGLQIIDYSPNAILTENIWYNVVFVWSTVANTAIGYLNGTQKFNTTHASWPTTLPAVAIGNGYNSSRYYKGSFSNLLMYNKGLSAAEVAQNFNATRGRYGI